MMRLHDQSKHMLPFASTVPCLNRYHSNNVIKFGGEQALTLSDALTKGIGCLGK